MRHNVHSMGGLHDPSSLECKFMLKLIVVVDVILSFPFLSFSSSYLYSGTDNAFLFMGSSFPY